MKFAVTTPLVFILVIFLNSCGSDPEEENYESRRMIPDLTQAPTPQPVNYSEAAIPVNSAIPVANRVVGRPGYVFNPYTQNMVEVNGLVSGTKVRDPLDPDPSNIFLVLRKKFSIQGILKIFMVERSGLPDLGSFLMVDGSPAS
jgi:hypothetical protein